MKDYLEWKKIDFVRIDGQAVRLLGSPALTLRLEPNLCATEGASRGASRSAQAFRARGCARVLTAAASDPRVVNASRVPLLSKVLPGRRSWAEPAGGGHLVEHRLNTGSSHGARMPKLVPRLTRLCFSTSTGILRMTNRPVTQLVGRNLQRQLKLVLVLRLLSESGLSCCRHLLQLLTV